MTRRGPGLAAAVAAAMALAGGEPTLDGVSAATRPGQSVVGSVASDYELLEAPRPLDAALPADAVLGLLRWSNHLSYGLANVAPPGAAAVLVLASSDPPPDRRLLAAVVQLCRELFPEAEVEVAVPGPVELGPVGAPVAVLGRQERRPLPTYTALRREQLELPAAVALADAIVLVPALTRDSTGAVRGALALVAGLVPGAAADDSLAADALGAVGPTYAFAAALPGRNHLLASHDPVALDAVAAQLLGAEPARVAGLATAAAAGLGKAAWDDVKLNGSPVPGVPQAPHEFGGPAPATGPGR